MGQTTLSTQEEVEDFRKNLVMVDTIGAVSIDKENICLFVDDPDGRRFIWACNWRAAAFLAAALVIEAEKVLLRQGMEFNEVKNRVREHYTDASLRINGDLVKLAREKRDENSNR